MGTHQGGSGTHGLLLSQSTHIGVAVNQEGFYSLVDVGPSVDVLDQFWQLLDIEKIWDIPF